MGKYIFLILLGLLMPMFQIFAQNTKSTPKLPAKPFIIGETFQFESPTLKELRTINVYLPLDYHPDSVQTYPVIYLLDGSADEDFIHVSGLVQFGSFPWINQLPPSIVVGISNIDRRRDFTFPTRNSKDKENNPTSGSSSKFIQFLETELQPLVKERYKTNGTKTLIGQSLGGLLATEILFKKPDMFDHYIIVSPSLWWDDESLLNLKPEINGKPESIFIAVGKEGKVMERTARSLFKKLKALNQPKVYFQYFPKQDHGDMLHLAVYAAFEKLF